MDKGRIYIKILASFCMTLITFLFPVLIQAETYKYDWRVFIPLLERKQIFVDQWVAPEEGRFLVLGNYRFINNSEREKICFNVRLFVFSKEEEIPSPNPSSDLRPWLVQFVSTDLLRATHYQHLQFSVVLDLEKGNKVIVGLEAFMTRKRFYALWDSRDFCNNFQVILLGK